MAFHLQSILFGIGLAVFAFIGFAHRQQVEPAPQYEYGELRVHTELFTDSPYVGRFYARNNSFSRVFKKNTTDDGLFNRQTDVLNFAVTQLPDWELCFYSSSDKIGHVYIFRRKLKE